MGKGAYQRRDCKRITKAKQRERDRVSIESIRGLRKAVDGFFSDKGEDCPPVSRMMPRSGITEDVKRWVSRGRK